MLDESMFEDIHEIAENSAYLKAVEEKDVSLEMLEQLPPYEELRGLEEKLRFESKLSFDSIFNEPTGYYMIKCFLIADYAVDKAIFIKDVEAYKSMRFESARRKVALLLYQRFVATDDPQSLDFKPGSSVFQIIQSHKGMDDKIGGGMMGNGGGGGGGAAGSGGAKGMEKSENMKSEKAEKTVVSSNIPSQSHMMTQMSATTGHAGGGNGGMGAHDEFGGVVGRSRNESTFQMGTNNNPIGVYGRSVRIVKERVLRGEAPKDLFDEVARDVMTDLKLDVYPRFQKSEFYKKYIRTKWIETQKVTVKDFTTFRVLGRGGFGAVHACRKKNSGQIYAMKCINKKLVKVKSALDNVLEERNVLTMMKSNFVTNLKYALQDEDTLYLIMDLMLGGDLKFHLINAGRFTEKRARFYAAQVLLGLEHVHGQCLEMGTMVARADAPPLPVEQVKRGMKLIGDNSSVVVARMDAVVERGNRREQYVIETLAGSYTVSAMHRVTLLVCRNPTLSMTPVPSVPLVSMQVAWWHLDERGTPKRFTHSWLVEIAETSSNNNAMVDTEIDLAWLDQQIELSTRKGDEEQRSTSASSSSERLQGSCAEVQHVARLFVENLRRSHKVFARHDRVEVTATWMEKNKDVADLLLSRKNPNPTFAAVQVSVPFSAAAPAAASAAVTAFKEAAAAAAPASSDCTTLLSLGADHYRPLQKEDTVSVCYVLHHASLTTTDAALMVEGGDPSFTYRQIDQIHAAINMDVNQSTGLAIAEIHSNTEADDKLTASASIEAVLKSGAPTVVGFGRFVLDRWKAGAAHVAGVSDVVMSVRNSVLTGSLKYHGRDVKVLFAPHPSAWTKQRVVARAIALAWGRNQAQDLSALDEAMRSVDPPQRVGILSVTKRFQPTRFVELEIVGDNEADKRFALANGMLTHNSCIYRDMKLENVLLDHSGHCRLSDLGLAVVTKVKIKGYAGTPGYTAPEMIKNKLYGPAADIFSYGVMLYRMLCGSKPFKGKVDRDLDKAVIERKPQFPKEIFSKEAILLLTGLLQKRPENRMGCGDKGIEEIKEHPFFESIDWGLLEAGYIDPPFVPNKFDVNAASLKDIGDFDRAKYKHVKLDDRFKQRIKNFEYVSAKALQDEMVLVLEKSDENTNFEKFAHQPEKQEPTQMVANGPCCTIA